MEEKFKAADEIVTLKRDSEKIIFNAKEINPIYFPRGGDEVLEIIEKIKKHGSFSKLPEDFCPPELFDFFLYHSLVVPVRTEEVTDRRGCMECSSRKGISRQKSIYLLLCQSCNQSCIYCFNGAKTYQKKDSLMMSEKVAFGAVESALSAISEGGRLEVVFFGGEPLMNWPLAKKVIRFCEEDLKIRNSKKELAYHITTNLTIFPDDLIEIGEKYNITFLVDVDGPPDIHNKTRPFVNGGETFDITAKNIRKLNDAGLKVALRATVTSHNVERMIDIAKTHKELGGTGSAFVAINPVDSDYELLSLELCPSLEKFSRGLREVFHSNLWSVENLYPFNEYLGRLKPHYKNRWGCGAPLGNTPVITVDGGMYSCIYLVGNKRYEVGHVEKGDFPREEVLEDMLNIVDIDRRSHCSECGFRYLCGGGCPVGVFSIAANPHASQEIKNYAHNLSCTVSKTVLRELFWSMAGEIKFVSDG